MKSIHGIPSKVLPPESPRSIFLARLMLTANRITSLLRVHEAIMSDEYQQEHGEHLVRADSFTLFAMSVATISESLNLFKGNKGLFHATAKRHQRLPDYDVLSQATNEDASGCSFHKGVLKRLRDKAAAHWNDHPLISDCLSRLDESNTEFFTCSSDETIRSARFTIADSLLLGMAFEELGDSSLSNMVQRTARVQEAFLKLSELIVADHIEHLACWENRSEHE